MHPREWSCALGTQRAVLSGFLTPLCGLLLASACGNDKSSDTDQPSVTSPSPTDTNAGVMPTTNTSGPTSSSSPPSPAGSASSSASPSETQSGQPSASVTSPSPTGGDSTGAGGATGGNPTPAGGGAGGNGEAGATNAGGSAGGAGGMTNDGGPGGAGPDGPADTGECTREKLQSAVDAYFEALGAGDPSTLPLAAGAKFTENGEEMEIGSGGLWTDAGPLAYSHSAFDTEVCMSATQAVVPEGGSDIPLALRLRLEGGEITEIETIAIRSGDYILGSNTGAMIASGDAIGWEEPVPEGSRASREELIAWMDKYFRLFPAGVCDTTSDCQRLENGGGDFVCSSGASCANGDPGPDDDNLVPRLIFADEERGIGVGFTMFQDQYTDMHMFKNTGGQIIAVHAILGEASGSGWD